MHKDRNFISLNIPKKDWEKIFKPRSGEAISLRRYPQKRVENQKIRKQLKAIQNEIDEAYAEFFRQRKYNG